MEFKIRGIEDFVEAAWNSSWTTALLICCENMFCHIVNAILCHIINAILCHIANVIASNYTDCRH